MQRQPTPRWFALALPAVLFVVILLALGFAAGSGLQVSADPQDPDLPPPFVGEPVTAVVELPDSFSRQASVDMAETMIYTQTFESIGLPANWLTIDQADWDDNPATSEDFYKWGTETITNGTSITGTRSVWAIGSGDLGGALDPISDTYPAGINSWLVYGPLDLSSVKSAHFTFDYILDVSNTFSDTFGVYVSTDGGNFNGHEVQLPIDQWVNNSYTIDDQYLSSTTYIGFNFRTGTDGADQLGALLDNFVLQIEPLDDVFLPMVIYDETPTPAPILNYQEPFDESGRGWETIRRRNTEGNIDNTLTIVSRTDSYLQTEVKSSNDYLIVSPLVKGRTAPFEIEVKAEIANEVDNSGFGIIFGADYNGDPNSCPNASFTGCFNDYYAVQVRYRTGDKTELEVQRISAHDAGNYPLNPTSLGKDVFESGQVDGDSENVWNIQVNADGTIIVKANGTTRMTLLGPRTIVNPYFGFSVFREEGSQGARVNLYHYCVGEQGDACDGKINGGGGTGATAYNYDFNDTADLEEWKDDNNGQGHNRTFGKATDNSIGLNNGKLEVTVSEENQFVIYSPLKQINSTSYSIETNVDLSQASDGDEYGIIWAANWDTSKPCPNPDDKFLSCMNTLYIARIKYVNSGTARVSINKINGQRDANGNLGFEQLAATDVGIDVDGSQTWRVNYNTSSGDINLLANGSSVLTANNKDYAAQKYFGLMTLTTSGNDLAIARFDYYRVTE